MTLDGELWINTGSPVKQQGVNDGRVSEIRNTGKVSPDAAMPAGGASAAQIRYSDNVAKTEAGTPSRAEG